MGIAIRRDVCETSLKGLVERYEKEARASTVVACPESDCRQHYVIYFGPATNEIEVRDGFIRYLKRDHPDHPAVYEIDESVPNQPL